MARPQAENGHIDIAHEIAEAFARTSLTRTESRVLWAILRKTWGWHKKLDRISLSQFQAMTGDDKHNLHDALRSLTLRGIIVRGGKGQRVEYGIQKDYEQWKPLHPSPTVTHGIIELTPAQGLTKTVVPVTNRPLYPSPTKPLYPSPTTKEKKETIQKKKTNKGGELPKKKTKTIEQAFEDNRPSFQNLIWPWNCSGSNFGGTAWGKRRRFPRWPFSTGSR